MFIQHHGALQQRQPITTKLLSGSRLGEVTVTDGTNTRYVTVSQGPCPA